MKRAILTLVFSISAWLLPQPDLRADPLAVHFVSADLRQSVDDSMWKDAPEQVISLMAQPMAIPRPATTATASIKVRAIHDGKRISFRLSWVDPERSNGGRPGQSSDAVALEFPVKSNEAPPPVFMGMKDNPVHIFHWRAQYQVDVEQGKPTVQELYPNMRVDLYPLEPWDPGAMPPQDEAHREIYSPARAAGNPQSYPKKGVDQVLAEGFGTSSVIENVDATGVGRWADGEWTVVITRPLEIPQGSMLAPGKGSFLGLAVWQGGQDEVGSRKSVTMSWTPIQLEPSPSQEAGHGK